MTKLGTSEVDTLVVRLAMVTSAVGAIAAMLAQDFTTALVCILLLSLGGLWWVAKKRM